ncbi:FG-GAP-like repeat-containing protein [Chloroflexota bacterium]
MGGTGQFVEEVQGFPDTDSFDLALGDLDGDGDLDAFVANNGGANSVWLNDGMGVFGSGQTPGDADSLGVALGDLDGDGDLDAFVANSGPNRVWFNDGDGGFTSGQALEDATSRGVALGDVDGDGDLDAFVANSGPNQVWLNDGDGHFGSGQALGSAISLAVALGDLDGDGDLDAFVANNVANKVWLNSGSGLFAASDQNLGDSESRDVSLADVDADGDLDAFVANSASFGDAPNTIWLNDGLGGFTADQSLGTASSFGVALGDVDGDGDQDAYVANLDAILHPPNRVWLNDGTGTLQASNQGLGAAESRRVALGDLDSDGDLDAFVANDGANGVWLNASRSDLSISKSVTPLSALPGERITYTLVYTNYGPQVIRGVVITDIVPLSVTNVSYNWSGAVVAPKGAVPYVWDVEDLLPGDGGTITVSGVLSMQLPVSVFTNTASITATMIDSDTTDNQDHAAVIVVRPDLSIVKTVTPEVYVAYHGEVTYTVVLSNAGEGDAHGLVLTDRLPAKVEFARWVPGDLSDEAERVGDLITWTGTVTARRAVTLSFVANHTGDFAEEVTNTASFTQAFGEGTDSATFRVIQPPIFTIRKTVTPTTDVAYHGEVTYTVVLSNDGEADAYGTRVTDTLPSKVAFARWVPEGRPSGAKAQNGVITWTGTVTADQAVAFSFVATHTGYYSNEVTNTAVFTHVSDYGSDAATFTVIAAPELTVTKTVSPSMAVAYHGEVTYTIVLSNDGVADAYGTLMTDTLPSGVAFARWLAEGKPDNAEASGDEITWQGTVQAGRAVTFTFAATHTGDYSDEVVNTAVFTHASGKGSGEAIFTVIAPPVLTIAKEASPSVDVAYHGEVTYTIVLSNDGVANAYGTQLTDTLPPEVDFDRWLVRPEPAVESGDVVTWVGTVDSGAVVEFSFVVSHTGDYSDLVANTAEFFHVSDQDSDAAMFQVLAPPDLTIKKKVYPVALLPGGSLTYTLRYTNTGPSLAHGVVISDRLPAGYAAAGYASRGATVTPTGSFSYTWGVSDLPPGEGGVITVTGLVSTSVAFGLDFANTVEITATTPDGDGTDNWDWAAVKVRERVLAVEPAAYVHTATVGTDLIVTVSTPIEESSVSAETLTVHGGFRGRLDGDLSVDSLVDHAEIVFDPNTEFMPGELVEASATEGIVVDAAPLVPHVWRFRAAVVGGTGVFYDSSNALGSSTSYHAALGDLDGDGDLDAFVANYGQGNSVWLNDGTGSYAVHGSGLGGASSNSVALGDLDGDGDLDAFVANYGESNRLWWNNGMAGFTLGQGLGTSLSRGLAVGDLDGDGDLDVFVANHGANRVWLNNGSGGFSDSGQTVGSSSSYDVALGDLDDDGDLDAFVANTGGNSVWLNQGGLQHGELGSFEVSGSSLGTSASRSVALGDVDGDGDLDALVGNVGLEGVPDKLWLNDGEGTFGDSGLSLGNSVSHGVALGDLDGDADLDLFVANDYYEQNGAPNSVFDGDGLGQFTDSKQTLGVSASRGVALGDVDGDGDLDAFIANSGQANRVWLNGNRTDLAISKSVVEALVVPRGPITYTLEFENQGAQVARNVVITDLIPLSVTQAIFVSSGAQVTATDGVTYAWKVQDLWPGDSGVITVSGVVSQALGEGMLFTNTAQITATVVDSDTTDNESDVGVRVVEPHLSIAKTVSPSLEVTFHGEVTYTVVVSNAGEGDGLGVAVTDALPGEVAFERWVTPPGGDVPDSVVSWTGNVAAGKAVTLTYVVRHTGWYSDVVVNEAELGHWSGNPTSEATFEVLGPPDLYIVKAVIPAVLLPGDAVTYTLEYGNKGPSVARRVVITDIVPVSVTQVSQVPSGAVVTPVVGVEYAWEVEDLPPGEGGAITITGVVSQPLAAGVFTNTATITSTTPDDDATDNESQAAVEVIVPELSIAKSVVPDTDVTFHGKVTYTVVVGNGGEGDALGVVVTDVLAARVEFVDWASDGQPGGASEADGIISWQGVVTAGKAVTLTYVVRHTGWYSDVVVNEAELGHWSGDPTSKATFEVVGPPDLFIVKEVIPEVLLPGDAVTYTLEYGNKGPSVARGVVITDIVPVSVTQVSQVPNGSVVTPVVGVEYAWEVEDLRPGEGGVITIAGVVSQPLAAGVFTNTATITSTTPDDDATDNESQAAVEVIVPELSIAKSVVPDTNVAYHGEVTYTVVVGNGGEGDALGVVVTDALPAQVEFVDWTLDGKPGGANEVDGTITWQGVVTAGEVVSLSFRVKHTGYYADNVTNSAEYAHWSDKDEAEATFSVVGLPSLVIDKTVSKETGVVYHSEVTYTVILSNEGEGDALGVVLTDALPVEVDFERWAGGAPPGGAIEDADVITWTGNLPSDESVTLRFVVSHVGAHGDVVTNRAKFDHITGRGQDEATFTVLGPPGLGIQKTASVASSLPGEPITYRLEYANTGPSFARGVVITDRVPVSLTNVSYASTGPAITPIGEVSYTWAVADMGPGEGGVITITGVLSRPLSAGVFTNTATITSTTPDEDLTDNEADAPLEVIVPVLSIAKSVVAHDPVAYHGQVTYTIILSNEGNGDGLGVVLTDALPAQVDFDGWVVGGEPQDVSVVDDLITWQGTVAAEDTVTFIFKAVHTGDFADEVTNKAEYTHWSDSDDSQASFSIIGPPVLAITKTVTPETDVAYHSEVTYTVVLSNSGEADAWDSALTDTLPDEVNFARWIERPAGAFVSDDEITWNGMVESGRALTISFVARHVGYYGEVVTNRAEYAHWTGQVGHADAPFTVIGPPVLTIDKSVTPSTDVGFHETVTYTVVLGNSGAGIAHDVKLTDTLPTEVDFEVWVPGGQPDGAAEVEDEINWLGTLASGEDVTLMFVVRHVGDYAEVVVNTAEFDHISDSDSDTATFTVVGPPVLWVSKVVTPEVDVAYHGEVTYTVELSNTGPGVAYGVALTDVLPDKVEFAGWVPGGQPDGAFEDEGQINWLGTLGSGEKVEFIFLARHVGYYADIVSNRAEYSHWSSAGDDDEATFTVIEPPDLSVSKTVTPVVDVAYHAEVTYTVVLSNDGVADAYDTVMTDTLPPEVDFVRWVPGFQPIGATAVNDRIVWTGTVPVGLPVTFAFVAEHTGYYGNEVINTAEFSHVSRDGDDDAIFRVIEPPILTISKSVNPELDVPIHSEVTYTLELRNDGVADAHLTQLTDLLPPQVEIARWLHGGPPTGTIVDGKEITWLGTVLAGVPVSFTFVATHTGDYADVVRNEAEFSQASGVGHDDATFIVLDPPDLTVEKTVSPTVLLPGDPITYAIAFANTGPSPAADVLIDDEIPSALEGLSFTSSGAVVVATGPVSYAWSVQDLEPGDGGVITVTGTVRPDAEYGLWITNTAMIASAMPDGNLADNESSAGTKVRERIVDVEPPSNVHTATATTNLRATAGGPVKKSSVTTQTFAVHGQSQGHLEGVLLWGPAGSEDIVFDPASEFFPGELVETSVTEGVLASSVPIVRHVWRFRAAVEGGTGQFVDTLQTMGKENSRAVALGDLNGDGDLDAFVVNDGPSDEVWLNNGRGRYTKSSQSFDPGDGKGVALADLDGDGDLDAMVANYSEANEVWINDGTATFAPAPGLGSSRSFGVALGDLDGDGDFDAYIANYGQSNRIWINDGLGAFTDSGQGLGVARSYGAQLGDLDGDGDLDAIVANYQDTSRVWLNDGMGRFESGAGLGSFTTYAVALGDLDGDSDLDAFVANSGQPNRVWRNDGQGGFDDSLQELGGSASSQQVALGDVDSDGDLDALVVNFSGADKIFLNIGTGFFDTTAQALGASHGYAADLGDVDGDGDLDAFVANGFGVEPNKVWLNKSLADVSVVKSAEPERVGLGQSVTYTLVYTNSGPQRAADVVLVDDVPDALVNLAFASTGASIVEVGAEPYTWEVEDLEPGSGGVITITGVVSNQLTGVFSATNRVTITHAELDLEPGNNSSKITITVDADRPIQPVLVEPVHGAVISDTTPLVGWQASPSDDLDGYLLQLGGETIDVGDVTQYIPAPLNDGIYNWTVSAYDGVRNLSGYPSPWTFTLDATPPAPPLLDSPSDGVFTGDTTPTLTWQSSPAPDVAGYLLMWDNGILDLGKVTQYTPPAALADGVYTWAVAAYDGLRNVGAYTNIWTLTVDTTPPGIQATEPVNGAVDVILPVALVINFTEPVDTSSFTFAIAPDPGNWVAQWNSDGSAVTLNHADFDLGTEYAATVNAKDMVGLGLAPEPFQWTFTTKDLRIFLPTINRP